MRYWIGVASKNHVALGVAGGFCQIAHGKAAPLKLWQSGTGSYITRQRKNSKVLSPGAKCSP